MQASYTAPLMPLIAVHILTMNLQDILVNDTWALGHQIGYGGYGFVYTGTVPPPSLPEPTLTPTQQPTSETAARSR